MYGLGDSIVRANADAYVVPILRGANYNGPDKPAADEGTYGQNTIAPILQGGLSPTGPNAGAVTSDPWRSSPLPLIVLGLVGVWLLSRKR